ncbi:hypothetical protein OHS59_24430 [Streptomyces sp. NBC_00414]|uniref:DUF6197 family protein n=1 Tax=Streptomyces sp. NBC_00414 TaxID=2975739 RepID=UPI002E208E94
MSTALHHPDVTALGKLPDDTYTYSPLDVYDARDAGDAHDDEVFRRSALLIARHGWCQGQGLLYVGHPHAPQAASLVGALAWAVTGDAESCSPRVRAALATVRRRLDPAGSALFSDWELLCAWNDAPARTRDETVALLLSCRTRPAPDLPADLPTDPPISLSIPA